MKYKYEDTFVNEIDGFNNHRMATIYSKIAKRFVIVFIICLGVYLALNYIDSSKVGIDAIKPCQDNLSVNNCFVLSTEK